ncbi:MAG TPA: DUF6625 family protein [Hanamia sp.]
MKHKIGIITYYLGNMPWYFSYFLHSCRYNPTIDFIIITDGVVERNDIPPNVFIHKKSIDKFKNIAAKKLGFEVSVMHPYKLCDLKPAYGFLFPEMLKSYDFWGHGDIDVMYGNIRDFMTDEILDNYDVISSRHDYVAGTFSLYKNTDQMNKLFMQSKDYKKVFTNPEHFCFDECSNLFNELDNGASIFDFPEAVQSMTYVVKKAESEEKLKAFFDFIIVEGVPGKIKWEKGKIIYKNKFEAMYYNLIRFKKECVRPKKLRPIQDTIYFTPKRIITKKKIEIPSL